MAKKPEKALQKTIQNDPGALIAIREGFPDTLSFWIEAYFKFENTTAPSSIKVKKRDLNGFRNFMLAEVKSDSRQMWSPRLSKSFLEHLKAQGIGDRTINRILAHLKTLSKWIHKLRAFPLGDPMTKIKALPAGSLLEVERALTPAERRLLLDAADMLPLVGGRSRDRARFKNQDRPVRKAYRPYRNRAIIYTLIETGMRRAAVTKIWISDIDFKEKTILVEEKGGGRHNYSISNEGLAAVKDYIEQERAGDAAKWKNDILFLSPRSNPHGIGHLSPVIINGIWDDVCKQADVEGKTPHSARHAMGKHIIQKTGNIAAVQRQLGHKNVTYSVQYSRITKDELEGVLNDR